MDQRGERAEQRAGKDSCFARHQLGEQRQRRPRRPEAAGDHLADARALAQVAIQKDRFAEVLLDRAEDLLARRAIGADDERIVAAHTRGEIRDDLLAADRGGARDLHSRQLVRDEVPSAEMDGIERSEARRDAVRGLEIWPLRSQALHQVDDLPATLFVQVEEVRIVAERVGVDVQVRRLVLLLAEGVDVPPPVAEVPEACVVGR